MIRLGTCAPGRRLREEEKLHNGDLPWGVSSLSYIMGSIQLVLQPHTGARASMTRKHLAVRHCSGSNAKRCLRRQRAAITVNCAGGTPE